MAWPVCLEFDQTGLVTTHTRYKPFGGIDAEQTNPPGSTPTGRRHFAGHPQQENTGLQYMKARWMDPATGTFLSVDPVVRNIANPQSLNAYSYAENNPISIVDPTGMGAACAPGPLPACGGEIAIPPVVITLPSSYPVASQAAGESSSTAGVSSGDATGGLNGGGPASPPGNPANSAPTSHSGTGDSLVDAAIREADSLERDSIDVERQTGKSIDFSQNLDKNGSPFGNRTSQDTTGGKTHGNTISLDRRPEVAINAHNHHPTGNRAFDFINRGPSSLDRTAARNFDGRWMIVRGTDGSITGARNCAGCGRFGIGSFGFSYDILEERGFRGSTQ